MYEVTRILFMAKQFSFYLDDLLDEQNSVFSLIEYQRERDNQQLHWIYCKMANLCSVNTVIWFISFLWPFVEPEITHALISSPSCNCVMGHKIQ